jgi:hypothetical protein
VVGLARWGHGVTALHRGALEILIPRYERGVLAERECACEMDGVVSAQREVLGQIARLPCELDIDPDKKELVL